MINSFYNQEELNSLGLKKLGKNVLISRNASFYGAENIEIGSNVRIDDFCILSGTIILKSNIHISAYCALYGFYGIQIDEYSGLSPRCTLLSATDDFSGDYLIGPMVNEELTNVTGGKIHIHKHSQIGAGSIVFPNVSISEGVAVGALSLINCDLEKWTIYAGIPVKALKKRSRKLLDKL